MYALLLEEQINSRKMAVNYCYCMLALAIFFGKGMFMNNSLIAPTPTQNINMGDSLLSKGTPPPGQGLAIITEKTKWNSEIRRKYKNAQITYVEDGIVHIKLTKYINSQPIRMNIVEVNRKINPNIELTPALASNNSLSRKASIQSIAQRNNSIIAINGTYFKPQTGVPLGTLMIDGKLLTGPIYNRVAMGIGDNDFKMARLELNAKLVNNSNEITVNNVNQPRMLSTYILAYTRDWGAKSPPTPQHGVQIAVQDNKVIEVSDGSINIPENGFVISGPKGKLEPFFNGKSVYLNINTSPNWDGVKHIISGGPYLVREGQIYVDIQDQKLGAIGGKNPRTAIGYTEDNDLILITIDGREQTSVGITLYDLAKYMKSIGCVNAMNLDGGGSSVMYVKGRIVNHPSITGGIALSNAFSVSVQSQISYIEPKE